ncbi:hypothetical protein CC80DRAFT_493742 [Byssothecium circinans]|uniref:Integral membrane protein-like protein n=1 Tax=Byssothecium circinans TaxID=147558 RepID=A0A6A5TPQ4_9PLEO|nr:hypothetical protein CC80DRAFT_493742 [Byssothecium circinans]
MAFRWYQAKLKSAPLLTQSVLFATGDVLAQQAVEKKGVDKHDFARTGRMAAYGGAVFGPAATKWYQFLARNVNLRSTNGTIATRVACDQFLFAPVNMAFFLSSMAYLEGASPKERLKKSYVTGMVKNCMVWPWVQAVNFRFVPLDLRVLVVNVVSLGWNCYLSYLNSGGASKTPSLEQKIKQKRHEGGELPPS